MKTPRLRKSDLTTAIASNVNRETLTGEIGYVNDPMPIAELYIDEEGDGQLVLAIGDYEIYAQDWEDWYARVKARILDDLENYGKIFPDG